jgi:hypothetical protein
MIIWNILWQFGIFYGNLVKFVAIWYILRPFGICLPFGMFGPRKIWQPCCESPFDEEDGDENFGGKKIHFPLLLLLLSWRGFVKLILFAEVSSVESCIKLSYKQNLKTLLRLA